MITTTGAASRSNVSSRDFALVAISPLVRPGDLSDHLETVVFPHPQILAFMRGELACRLT